MNRTTEKRRTSVVYLRWMACIGLCGMLLACTRSEDNDSGDDGDDTESDSEPVTEWKCLNTAGGSPEYLTGIGCYDDFTAVAAAPMDSSLPGALSVKTVIDQVDDNAIYFQNSNDFQIHYDFASVYLSGTDGLPVIKDMSSFEENYYDSQRRFLLGAVTYYEGPDKWTYEISPYDTADATMVQAAYEKIAASTYFGDKLYFHPTGTAVEAIADELPESVPVITTDQLYPEIDYQPLNVAKSCGKLVFVTADQLKNGTYVGFEEIVVMDSAPNDISVVQGIITEEFQTPLSHVNVLSQNRGTPNMGLRGAWESEELNALKGKWVSLDVGPNDYEIKEVTAEEAAECAVKPDPIDITMMDLSVTEMTDVQDIVDPEADTPLVDQISAAIPAFGGKGSHFAALSYVEEANAPTAFVIPVYFYNQFMEENGFNDLVDEYLVDENFKTDAATRDQKLEELRDAMMLAPINEDFITALKDKLHAEFQGLRMRFRSSTNAEDLGDFTGAGLYTSKTGDPDDPSRTVEDALREVWGSIWYFRAFEERTYRGIDHKKVGMALLVHHSYPDEEANGVAVTSNPFNTSGLEPAFYINVQVGDNSVVQPDPGVTTDQFIYYYDMQNQPIEFIDNSSLVPEGETVLTAEQTHELGVALKAIHTFFYDSYGPIATGKDWYAMDVEFKLDEDVEDGGTEPVIQIKQARPYPGR